MYTHQNMIEQKEIQMSDTGRFFSAASIAKCAAGALDNWDFDVIERSDEYREAYKASLEITESDAEELWCEDGPMDLDSAFSDIWDWLAEYAMNTAINSI